MSKIKIKKEDKYRVLLTELLPYEVPIIFSNDGFYQLVTNQRFSVFFDRVKALSNASSDTKGRKYGIPLNYVVRKTAQGDTRLLSIIHPVNQIDFVDFYHKYDSLILHLCSKSPFSLRRAAKVAKFYYSPEMVFEEDDLKNAEVEVEPEVLDMETKLLKSYFTYKPIDLIYKFYEKNEYQRLEQKFNLSIEFDISKCFYNIYTHSITWAIKNKESAKKSSRQDSFENSFDKIMQLSNYNETHGIVVGPEVSRIFAEIILQQVDINVLRRLTDEQYELGKDYEIRRYVDDYFVFANDEKILKKVLFTYKEELVEYKLYINDQKTIIKESPFITDIAVGKRELKHLLESLVKTVVSENSMPNQITGQPEKIRSLNHLENPFRLSQNFIKDFQCIVKRNHLTYDILSKDVIRFLKTELVRVFKDPKIDKNEKIIEGFLLLILDISFYSYSLNVTSSTTFKLAQMIVLICKFLEKKNEELRQTIYSKISRDADFVISIFQQKVRHNETNIETLNLLIALKKLDSSYLITEKKIRKLFRLDQKSHFKTLNYFHIVTLLYYIEDNTDYDSLKKDLESSVVNRFHEEKDPFSKAELTLLFFDFINCPYVSIVSKKRILTESSFEKSSAEQPKIIANIMQQKTWFVDWDSNIDLETILKKKEWGASY